MPWTERTIRYLTQDELKRFFAAIYDQRDKTIFALIYHYGVFLVRCAKTHRFCTATS